LTLTRPHKTGAEPRRTSDRQGGRSVKNRTPPGIARCLCLELWLERSLSSDPSLLVTLGLGPRRPIVSELQGDAASAHGGCTVPKARASIAAGARLFSNYLHMLDIMRRTGRVEPLPRPVVKRLPALASERRPVSDCRCASNQTATDDRHDQKANEQAVARSFGLRLAQIRKLNPKKRPSDHEEIQGRRSRGHQ